MPLPPRNRPLITNETSTLCPPLSSANPSSKMPNASCFNPPLALPSFYAFRSLESPAPSMPKNSPINSKQPSKGYFINAFSPHPKHPPQISPSILSEAVDSRTNTNTISTPCWNRSNSSTLSPQNKNKRLHNPMRNTLRCSASNVICMGYGSCTQILLPFSPPKAPPAFFLPSPTLHVQPFKPYGNFCSTANF